MLRTLARFRILILRAHPAKLVGLGYAFYIAIGWLLLSLPFASAEAVGAIDHLFIAVSAVSTTGLVSIDPGSSYTFWGQLIIIVLIQLGGLGYMAFSSFIILSAVNPNSRLCIRVARTTFSLPEDFDVRTFLGHVLVFSVLSETLGALILYWEFSAAGVKDPVWSAIFHSISAYGTARFSLFSNGFEGFADNPLIILTIALLSYSGSIGFLVLSDTWRVLTGQKARLGFTSKMIIRLTLLLAVLGTVMFIASGEWAPELAPWEIALISFFQTMTAQSTVSFNTVPIGDLALPAIMVIYFLMIFGASPAGTGGGLKITTLAVLIGIVRSVTRQRSDISFMRRVIPMEVRTTAITGCAHYVLLLGSALYLLTLTEPGANFETMLFEALSAMGTVGLSMGLTGDLSPLGKLVVVALMYVGRVGFVTIGLAVSTREVDEELLEEDDAFVI